MYKRILDLSAPLAKKSHFLLGPRATGKSWLIRNQLKNAQVFDLLNSDIYDRFLKRPHALAEEVNKKLVVIDEIQKLPRLLDEVHQLIEERNIHFLLTGSSARKLKRGGANLLAGRARTLHMYPLTSTEIPDFDLVKYCNVGGLPLIYQSDDAQLDLKEYVQLYLKEEIIAEAVVRKIEHYARFLDVIGRASGEQINYQKIADDSGVPVRTVANFTEILKDTLLAFEMEPFRQGRKRKVATKSKLFLFDVGVANYLAGRRNLAAKSDSFGKAFEHFIIQEIRAYLGYNQIDLPMTFWRTLTGSFEVDCIIGNGVAIEIKSAVTFNDRHIQGLLALKEEAKIKTSILVLNDPVARTVNGIHIMNWRSFLTRLWRGDFF